MGKEEKVNKFVDISKKIAEEISKFGNDNAVKKVILKKVDEETDRRAELLDKGFEVWGKTEKELKKCVPDLISHAELEEDDSGNAIVNKAYSDSRFKEKQALKKKLADIEVALMLAFGETQDYGKLETIIKSSGSDKSNKEQK